MDVRIEVINIPGSVADWKLAEGVAESKLPELNKDQESIAKAFGIPESDYRRSVLAKQIAEARYRSYAREFGEFLARAAAPHSVQSAEIVYDLWEGKFYCYLKRDSSAIPLRFDANLVTVPLEQGDQNALRQAEKAIQFGVDEALRISENAGNSTLVKKPS
jgi:hypothetical protein